MIRYLVAYAIGYTWFQLVSLWAGSPSEWTAQVWISALFICGALSYGWAIIASKVAR